MTRRPIRPCLVCGTPTPGPRCPEHGGNRRAMTTTQRGYGAQHQQLRATWQQRINSSIIICPSCLKPIVPGRPWDLGHSDDRTLYIGPQHAGCNRNTATAVGGAGTDRDTHPEAR